MNFLDYIYINLYFFYKKLDLLDYDIHLTTVIPLSFVLGALFNTILNLLALFIFHIDINKYVNIGVMVVFMILIHFPYINKKRGETIINNKIRLYNKTASVSIFFILIIILTTCLIIIPSILKHSGVYDRMCDLSNRKV